jgi:hypothetical protein
MESAANPQGCAPGGSSPDTRALAARLRALLDCTPAQARANVVRAEEDHRHRDAPYQDWGVRHELRKVVLELRSRTQSPPPHPRWRGAVAQADDEADAQADDETDDETDESDDDDDGMVEVCPACGTTRLDTQLIQTRGGDEGATKFTKCLNPDCAANLIRPVLRRKKM